MITETLFTPVLVGVKVMVNGWLPPGRIGELGCGPILNMALSVPMMSTFGVPVRFREAVPTFWIVKMIAALELPTS